MEFLIYFREFSNVHHDSFYCRDFVFLFVFRLRGVISCSIGKTHCRNELSQKFDLVPFFPDNDPPLPPIFVDRWSLDNEKRRRNDFSARKSVNFPVALLTPIRFPFPSQASTFLPDEFTGIGDRTMPAHRTGNIARQDLFQRFSSGLE